MDAVMLLCDAAQVHEGKLYILGGGFSTIWVPHAPTPVTLAVKLSVPWDQANQPLAVKLALLTDDGQPVEAGDLGPIEATGNVEVGRPPGVKQGIDLDVPIALPFGTIALGPGGYVWQLTVNDEPVARAPMRVMQGLPGTPMGNA
jgi:hypothetical protein